MWLPPLTSYFLVPDFLGRERLTVVPGAGRVPVSGCILQPLFVSNGFCIMASDSDVFLGDGIQSTHSTAAARSVFIKWPHWFSNLSQCLMFIQFLEKKEPLWNLLARKTSYRFFLFFPVSCSYPWVVAKGSRLAGRKVALCPGHFAPL